MRVVHHIACRAVLFLIPVLTTLSNGTNVRAERDLVFAAQYYRRVSPSTLRAQGASHLYRINPDGSRRTRLTFGTRDDYFPQWSPDGKRILFLRMTGDDPDSLCLVGADGGKVTRLLPIAERTHKQFLRAAWSPTGETVTAVFYNFGSSSEDYTLYLVDVATRKVREVRHTRSFAWSPDGLKLYLDHRSDDQILDVTTGRQTRVTAQIDNPCWLDNESLAGTFDEAKGTARVLRVISASGKLRWSHHLTTASKSRDIDDFGVGAFLDSVSWHRVAAKSPSLIAEWQWNMSDGTHANCYLVNYRTGRFRLLHTGRFMGFDARTRRVAVAADRWVGEYKRGGARVGLVQLVSLRTRRARTITHGFTTLAGGDWRPGQ